jgi:hypothetical protein
MMCVVGMVQKRQRKVIVGVSVARKGELQSAAHFYEHKLTSERDEMSVEMCASTAKRPVPQSYCQFNLLLT